MTDKYAVIGNPIGHSKSPIIHQALAKQTHQDISYEALEAPVDGGFTDFVADLKLKGYKGLNITVPFKFEALFHVSKYGELMPSAAKARAVNTIAFNEDGTVIGHNTDGIGLVTDITRNHQQTLQAKRVLLMGAGGAAYGVVLPLLEAGAILHVANRTPDKAQALAAAFNDDYAEKLGTTVKASSYQALEKQQFDIIINATSSGLTDELPPISADNFAEHAFAYDMMYGRETPFMKQAREAGAQVADGLGMLVEQAAEAFYIWRGVRPLTQPVIAQLRNA